MLLHRTGKERKLQAKLVAAILAAISLVLAGCGQPNLEQKSASFQQLSPAEAKKRLDETMARRNGKLPPGQVQSSTPSGQGN